VSDRLLDKTKISKGRGHPQIVAAISALSLPIAGMGRAPAQARRRVSRAGINEGVERVYVVRRPHRAGTVPAQYLY